MKKFFTLLFIFSSILITNDLYAQNQHKVDETKLAVRDLWVDHIFWIRSAVIAHSLDNAKYEKSAEAKIVENANHIADVIKPFYGQEARDGLFKLLAGHWGAVKGYMTASYPKKNTKAQDKAATELTNNAREISKFLSGANPNLPEDVLFSLLAAHGGHHIQEINQVNAKDYDGDAKTWDMMKAHIYTISDALVDAIAKQFPKKF